MKKQQQSLTDYLPKPHPTKQVFARYHTPIAAVARFMGFSSNYVCNLLNGFARVSPENDAKLHQFAQLVEAEARGEG
jgi:hypothetical protein